MITEEENNPATAYFSDVRSASLGQPNTTWLQEQWSRSVSIIETGRQESVIDTLSSIGRQLAWYKRNNDLDEWAGLQSIAWTHPLYNILKKDPFVCEARAAKHPVLSEPHLLDYLYGCLRQRRAIALVEPAGRRIFEFNATTNRSKAIRRLRLSIAEEVIEAASRSRSARIASITCGHLRELDSIPWSNSLDVGAFLAIDRSNEITSRVRNTFLHDGIKVITSNIWQLAHVGIVLNGYKQSDFNLIYSVGALDSSDDVIAEKLVEESTRALAPGGRLILVNSKPLTEDVCFQEIFLDQKPFCRDRTDIDFLFRHVRQEREFNVRIDDSKSNEFIHITVERHRVC